LLRAAHVLPVGRLAGENVHELLLGQVVNSHGRVHNSRHANHADLVVNQLGSVDTAFLFGKDIGVADIRRALGNLGQTGAAAAALHDDLDIGVLGHELGCGLLDQRLHRS